MRKAASKAGWQHRQIGDVCEVIAGQSPEGRFYNATGKGMPFYQGKKDFGEKYIGDPTTWTTDTTKIAHQGDILMSVRAPVGPVNFSTDDVCIGRGLAAIRCRTGLNRDFLFYQLWSLQPEIAGKEGAVFASINKSDIEHIRIAIAPFPEQQRIVGILDEAFDGIATAKANAEKNLQNARALFESHLQSVFTQRGDGWLEKRLGDLVDAKCSLSYGIVQPGEEFPGGLPIVRPTDLTTKFIEINGLKRIDPILAGGYSRTALSGVELLLCVRGSTGVVCVASKELAGANVTRGIVPICFDRSFVTQEFGYYVLASGPLQKQIREKTYGAALMQINIRDLRDVMLPFPSLLDQERIVAKLDPLSAETQRLSSLYQQKLTALDALKKSLLDQAFAGAL
jgi:type I restriction enzyme, S subunit